MTQERKVSEEEEKLVPKGIVKFSNEVPRITLARKVYESYIYIPVPQTDTGR